MQESPNKMIDPSNIGLQIQLQTNDQNQLPLLDYQNDPYYRRMTFDMEKKPESNPTKLKNKEEKQLSYIYPKKDEQYCWPAFLQGVGTCCTPIIIFCPCLCCCFTPCCCDTKPLFSQDTQNNGILQSWGSYTSTLPPGLHVINPVSQSIMQVNMQTNILQLQQIALTKDNVQFRLTLVVFYRVTDPMKLVYRLGKEQQRLSECIRQISVGTVRMLIGENILQQVIQKRELISQKCTEQINRIMMYWGVYIEVCSLKEIILDEELQNILSAVAQTKRLSQTMLINFRAEVECSKLIKECAELLNTKSAFQIRYLTMLTELIGRGAQEDIIMIKTRPDDLNE